MAPFDWGFKYLKKILKKKVYRANRRVFFEQKDMSFQQKRKGDFKILNST